jgi:hypothetical protein
MDIYNNSKETTQQIYDSFNNFVFADETRIFNKMAKKIELYLSVQDIVGDIMECGVFKGSGMAIWLKIKKMYEPNSNLKVIGLDYFNKSNVLDDITIDQNKTKMNDVLTRVDQDDLTIGAVSHKLTTISDDSFILLQGDAGETSNKYASNNPGLKIKLLYMDLDLGDPTYHVIKNIWKNISINGIIVFGEYAYHCWDESVGVDTFLKELPENHYKLVHTKIQCPTLYLIKLM